MEARRLDVRPSAGGEGAVRVSVNVAYDDGYPPEPWWFDVPAQMESSAQSSADPWLVSLLPLAVSLGEPLRLPGRADPRLLDNAQRLMRIWKCWYPHLHVIPIDAEEVQHVSAEGGRRTVSLFTAGIDSFFTVLRHIGPADGGVPPHLDELLYVWGYDIPLDNPRGFELLRSRLEMVAGRLGLRLQCLSSNLRQTRLSSLPWPELCQGAAIVAGALMLQPLYATLLLPSTYGFKYLGPWGTHPLTDHLFSTTAMTVVHDALEFDRVQKIEFVSGSALAMETLHVCNRAGSEQNCGRCLKCYGTMTALMLLGARGRARTFDWSKFDERKLSRLALVDSTDQVCSTELIQLAERTGRVAVARAIKRSKKRSRWLVRGLVLLEMARRSALTRRVADMAERALLSPFVT